MDKKQRRQNSQLKLRVRDEESQIRLGLKDGEKRRIISLQMNETIERRFGNVYKRRKRKRGIESVALGRNRMVSGTKEEASWHSMPDNGRYYLFPFALLWVWQSI